MSDLRRATCDVRVRYRGNCIMGGRFLSFFFFVRKEMDGGYVVKKNARLDVLLTCFLV